MARREYSQETKAAVMAALLTGQSISQVAKEYQMPKGTVSHWRAGLDRPLDRTDDSTKKEIGELILAYLKASLQTLRAQVVIFSNEQWLRKQAASEVAVLHGVLSDKAIRLLEALSDKPETEDV